MRARRWRPVGPVLAPVAGGNAPLARRNPVAKLGAVFALTFGLLASVDPVTPALALAVELAVVPLFGLRYRDLAARSVPVLLSAASIALVQVLFGAGPALGSQTLLDAAGLALRVLAIALPAVLGFATIDPTDLADALVQQLRLPARFAIGALAALRLLPLLAADWRMLTLARRARGLSAGRNPIAHLRMFAGTGFALLVGAIRRAGRLALAMDARGFAAGVPRSHARQQHFTWADAALLGAALGVVTLALLASVTLGTFRPVF